MSSNNPGETASWDCLENDEDNLLLMHSTLGASSSTSDEKCDGFDVNTGDSWIYPSNLPERAYQYNIVQKALFQNTLVVLPTGLGKTFIAAVVMYNIYRWYPKGKIIFMAPTRPLVAQQIDACCKIMGIPSSHSVEITGKLNKTNRCQMWHSKRVFFATPQSVQSDICDEELKFPFKDIKLIVVDEAHRAKGRYAYTEVVARIWEQNKYFRMLALSATPGRRKEDVEEVIRNLFISHMEVRTEDAVDVLAYVHKKQMKTIVVPLGQKLSKIRDELLAIADPHLRKLLENNLIAGRPGKISRNWLVMEHKKFRETLVNNSVPHQRELNTDFSICISVYHAIELLERHGLRVFLNNFDEADANGSNKIAVVLRPDMRRLIDRVRREVGPDPFAYSDQSMINGQIAPIPMGIDFGHPKFEIARDHVITHFEKNKESRAIIFCEYRDSVKLMHRLLLQHTPLIRPRVFVGQGGTGSIRAVTQQQQLKVMNDFRSGESNVLIATSVAEEGIDVGEVDLIVCFDINTSNPTRFVQRIGRTGRKKDGKVLLLATEGKEHAVLKDVLSERNSLNKSMSRGKGFSSSFYNQAPRMVPPNFSPKCMKQFLEPSMEENPKSLESTTKSKIPKNSKKTNQHDLRHFFQKGPTPNSKKKTNTGKANESVSIHSPAEKFVEDIETLSNFSLTTSNHVSTKMAKKIAKYVRNNAFEQTISTEKAFLSSRMSEQSKHFMLDYSPTFVSDIWIRIQNLRLRGIDETNPQAKGATSDDRQTIRIYQQMLNIFESKQNIANFVESKCGGKDLTFSYLVKKYDFLFGDANIGCFQEETFQYISETYQNLPKTPSPHNSALSMVYDDATNDSFNHDSFIETAFGGDYVMDSKYMSQWEEDNSSLNNEGKSVRGGNNKESTENEIENNHTKKADLENWPSKIYSQENDNDDDIIFVGVVQQSTPLRQTASNQYFPTTTEKQAANLKTGRSVSNSVKNSVDISRDQQSMLHVTQKPKTQKPLSHFIKSPSNVVKNQKPLLAEISKISPLNIKKSSGNRVSEKSFFDMFDSTPGIRQEKSTNPAIQTSISDICKSTTNSITSVTDNSEVNSLNAGNSKSTLNLSMYTYSKQNTSSVSHSQRDKKNRKLLLSPTKNSPLSTKIQASLLNQTQISVDHPTTRKAFSNVEEDSQKENLLTNPARNQAEGTIAQKTSLKDLYSQTLDSNLQMSLVDHSKTPTVSSKTRKTLSSFAYQPAEESITENPLSSPVKNQTTNSTFRKSLMNVDTNSKGDCKSLLERISDIETIAESHNSAQKIKDLIYDDHLSLFDDQFDFFLANSDFTEGVDDHGTKFNVEDVGCLKNYEETENAYSLNNPSLEESANTTNVSNLTRTTSEENSSERNPKILPNKYSNISKRSPLTYEHYKSRSRELQPSGPNSNNLQSSRSIPSTKADSSFKKSSPPYSKHSTEKLAFHSELQSIEWNHFSEKFEDELFAPDLKSTNATPCSSQSRQEDSVKRTPSKSANNSIIQVSPCLLSKRALTWKEIRAKYHKPEHPDVHKRHEKDINESYFPPKRKCRRLVISSESEENDSPRKVLRSTKRDIEKKKQCKKKRERPKAAHDFLDMEAILSGSGSEDEIVQTIGRYLPDSIIIDDDDDDCENDPENMTNIYLESTKSPKYNQHGGFKIPAKRQYNDTAKIFSQAVEHDITNYMKDSFVVSDSESDVETTMCPLERAEAILKSRRRNKRKLTPCDEDEDEIKTPVKKKRVLRINSSEDDDFT